MCLFVWRLVFLCTTANRDFGVARRDMACIESLGTGFFFSSFGTEKKRIDILHSHAPGDLHRRTTLNKQENNFIKCDRHA